MITDWAANEEVYYDVQALPDGRTLAAAARFLGVAEKTAEHWYYEYLKRQEKRRTAAKDLQPVGSLGIDELSLKKDTGSSAAC